MKLIASFVCLFTVLLCAGVQAFECEGVEPVAGNDVTLDLVGGSRGIFRPVDLQAPPGDTSRLFVLEQKRGRIRIIHLPEERLDPEPFLDIRSKVDSGGNEQGLLGLAFHPNYSENGLFFVNYTRNPDGRTVIERYSVSAGDPDIADPASAEAILTYSQPFSNHNAGQLAFGPNDGYLYISTGDGGSGGDPRNNAQTSNTLLGKMLRIDVDGSEGGLSYAIPPDNPFTGDGPCPSGGRSSGTCAEIWSFGLRNPWRFSFDPENGDLYIADVGQGDWEEIDYRPGTSTGGENYEWRVREGDHTFNASTSFTAGTRVAPLYEYPHGGGAFRGCSITGGVVYRGCRLPDLHGQYFFADYCNNWIGTLRVEDGQLAGSPTNRTAALNAGIAPARIGEISSFGTDARGEVYVCDLSSRPPAAAFLVDPSSREVEIEGGEAVVTLDASRSRAGQGGVFRVVPASESSGLAPLAFRWTKVSGPDGDVIDSPEGETTAVTFTRPGEYVYRLTVDDNGTLVERERSVTVLPGSVLPEFIRGDANTDGKVDISDPISILLHLFVEGAPPSCMDAADVNDGGTVDLSDAIFTFGFLFRGEEPPAAPGHEGCGVEETTEDGLDCASYPPCEG